MCQRVESLESVLVLRRDLRCSLWTVASGVASAVNEKPPETLAGDPPFFPFAAAAAAVAAAVNKKTTAIDIP